MLRHAGTGKNISQLLLVPDGQARAPRDLFVLIVLRHKHLDVIRGGSKSALADLPANPEPITPGSDASPRGPLTHRS